MPLPTDDVPPADSELPTGDTSVTATGGECAYPGCTNAVPKKVGKGAPRKYCDDHVKAPKPTATSNTSDRIDKMVKRIQSFYEQIGMGLAFAGQVKDAETLTDAAPELADSWRGLLSNSNVYKKWDSLLTGSSTMAVVTTHAMFIAAIASNHGLSLATMLKRKSKEVKPDE